LIDRAADLWEPLLAVADLAGSHWPDTARRAAVVLTSQDDGDEVSLGNELLADCRRILAVIAGDHVSSTTLVTGLRDLTDARWAEYGSTGLSAHRLARMLGEYGIKPSLDAAHSQRGYSRAAFTEAFERWLAPPVEVSEPSKASYTLPDLQQHADTSIGADTLKCREGVERRGRHRRPETKTDGRDTYDTPHAGLLLDGTMLDLEPPPRPTTWR